jgi:anti-sigma-K factor RskA
MPTQPQQRRPGSVRRCAAVATAAIAALAIAAPVAQATAATPRAVVQTPADSAGSVTGPTLSGNMFNGGTVIVTSPSPATGTVTNSP